MKYKKLQTLFSCGMLIVVAFSATQAFGQEGEDSHGNAPITRSGSAALLMSLSGPSTFGLGGPSANGASDARVTAGAGMKYFLSDGLAGKVLLTFASTGSGPDSARDKFSEFGIGLGIESHCRGLFSISPYWGGGVGLTMRTFQPINKGVDEAGTGKVGTLASVNDSKTVTTRLGLTLVAGFDWFFTQSMAIGSEISFGFGHSSTTNTDANGKSTDDPSVTEIGFSGSTNMHFVVYF